MNELYDIDLEEVSLVDKGANPGAKIALFKRDMKTEAGKKFPASDYAYVPDTSKPSTWKLRLTSTPGGDPDPKIVGAAVVALGKGFRGQKVQIPTEDLQKVKNKVLAAWKKANPDKEEVPGILKASFDEMRMRDEIYRACDGMPTMFDTLQSSVHSILYDDQVKEKIPAIEESLSQFHNALMDTFQPLSKGGSDMSDDLKKQVEDLQSQLEEVTKRAEEAEAALKAGEEDFDKSELPEEVRKRLEDMEAVSKAQEDTIQKMKDEAMTKEFIAKAEIFKNLPIKSIEFGPILKAISQNVTEDVYKEIERVLTAADEGMGKVFKEIGHNGADDDASALAIVTKRAEEMAKENPGMSMAEARGKVWASDPELKKRYDSERTNAH